MAELLIKAVDHTHQDPTKDQSGAYKKGMPVLVQPDGHQWGAKERLPKFAVLKFPGVSEDKLEKYVFPDTEGDTPETHRMVRRRLWKLRWNDLPAGAKAKLRDTGALVIKVGGYAGEFDYTWQQVKGFFRNQRTNQDETEDI